MAKNKWINAFRLRTLPLAFSCIIMGSGLAMADNQFNLIVFILALVTTLFLQILSNLANDYGDFVKGTDNEDRVGPYRTMQSGLITKNEMIKAMWVIALFCSIFGVWLIYEGTIGLELKKAGLFAILGLTAMGAAVKYTMGKNPYGYAGFGDVFVFLFFGWLGVIGSYFLHTHTLNWYLLLPASAIGFFTTAVLNINNMRDHEEDAKTGKNTLVVRMGIVWAKKYHFLLNFMGILFMIVYTIPDIKSIWLFLFGFVLFIKPARELLKNKDHNSFDPYLKKQAIATFLFTIIFVVGINL
ncbi:MAG: 1,4-dihydroxy-2-naphthoate polyprenyltransferase [Candidatus Marinimicrobia bacterium]|nr:1,4-dihydroxy-2-naphthoate polyprenyltransferase [Candidatus Neomarinimicrobiota bacterium]MBT3501661.1 1,4-dihydroxy-2-naphthoate polyprenyltransferase [Candidatus Neomarinimicrobiota bacterium]MBT3839839.1 1,4-dihydroxy-2-naphthoate polyprenyltransferase [Candidatus Neomarinimicrobiota bacterium]MBT3998427.1 1,4-dihydroxy-2-naphthoate polyprenyltransferase [Candidatus Neomarinimicrobiota bacterium]MBT4580170.1 1,4-dihydroxy-2-naphthoate polyprenyltransferase [Candidatus Neomarinimicrobiota